MQVTAIPGFLAPARPATVAPVGAARPNWAADRLALGARNLPVAQPG
ncbi:MAG: hypothetical protein JWM80_5031, partial [Cyanobacteria bacterium RYN_339]|nr:hypothetical protein [Cyanobacteria bacterium RYN_339]